MSRKKKIMMMSGLEIEIIPALPAGGVIICGPKSYQVDDIQTECMECGAKIWMRPYNVKAAIRICMPCGQKLIDHAGEKGELYISEEGAADVEAYRKRRIQ